MRLPLYPLFLAAVQKGLDTNIRYIQAAQIAIVAGILAIFYFLARRLSDPKLALLAAILLAFYAPLTIRAALIMSEALFVFMLLLSLYLVIVAVQDLRRGYFVAGGLALALAALTRPVVLLLPALLVPLFLVASVGRLGLKRSVGFSSLFVIAFTVVLLPWGIRNSVTLDEFTVLPSSGGANLWAASHANWEGFVEEHMAYAWTLDEFFDLEQGDYYISSQADERFMDAALGNIKDDPKGWLARNAQKLVRISYYSFSQELRDAVEVGAQQDKVYGSLRGLDAVTIASILLTLIGALLSLRNLPALIVLVTGLYFLAVEFVSFAEPRHLLPIVPLYILLASMALGWLARLFREDPSASGTMERQIGRLGGPE